MNRDAPASGDDVGRDFLAGVLGVDQSSLTHFQNEGMPKSGRAAYPLAACVQWYVERERTTARAARGLNDLDQARQRKTIAEAKSAELDLAEKEGRVLPLELHETRLRERLEPVDGNLRALGRYQPDVKAAVTDEAADALLDRMSDEIRAELFGLSDEID